MLTTSEGEFDTKNVTRNIVFKVKIYLKNILFLLTSARILTFLLRNRWQECAHFPYTGVSSCDEDDALNF